ncbi:MAG: hypothetical protein IPJ46_11535 [Anaerolineales bacterium]|nr:hypothetical protein [Anaerolineales bacterium]
MAHILPDTPPQSMPKEVLRVFRALKSLPDSYYVWHHLAPWQPDAPDFLVINEQGRTLLIKVSSAASDQASTAAQMLLLEDDKKELGRNENVLLENFVGALKLPADQNIETLVIFPNIQHKQAAASRLERRAGEPHWVGKEIVQSDSGLELNQYLLSAPLDPIWLEKLRQHFTPEIVIQPEMTVRQPIERRTQAGLTSYLLDYDQEAAVKTDLELPEDDQSLPSDLRLNIINGVAGSGKTLILLYRLRLLYRLYPNKKFLVLTHNRPLSHDMESRFPGWKVVHRVISSGGPSMPGAITTGPNNPNGSNPLTQRRAKESSKKPGGAICKNPRSACICLRVNWIGSRIRSHYRKMNI